MRSTPKQSIAATVSLGLAILMAVSWPVSFSTSTELTFYPLTIWDYRGRLSIGFLRSVPPPATRFEVEQVENFQDDWIFESVNERPQWGMAGINGGHFFFETGAFNGAYRRFDLWFVDIPYWLLLPPTLLLPVAWTRSYFKRRKIRREGCCVHCGYDLRASPDRCPECGSSAPSVA